MNVTTTSARYRNSVRPLRLGVVLCVVLLAALSIPAKGDAVSSDVSTIYRGFEINDGGSSFFAYSRQDSPNASGPNADTRFAEHGVAGFISPVPVEQGTQINVTRYLVITDSYSPVVKATSASKPSGGDSDFLNSYSALGSNPVVDGSASVALSGISHTYVAAAIGEIVPGGSAKGAAAGAVFDPSTVAPGAYPYSPTLDVSFQLSNIYESGGADAYALDSRLTNMDTFVSRGQPLSETLWHLTIGTSGPTTSPSNLEVNFAINPLARSLGILNPAMSDSQIATAVRNALTLDPLTGTVSLNDFPLFSSDTLFTVSPQDGNIEAGVVALADIVAAPEPGTALLFAVGGLAICVLRRRTAKSLG